MLTYTDINVIYFPTCTFVNNLNQIKVKKITSIFWTTVLCALVTLIDQRASWIFLMSIQFLMFFCGIDPARVIPFWEDHDKNSNMKSYAPFIFAIGLLVLMWLGNFWILYENKTVSSWSELLTTMTVLGSVFGPALLGFGYKIYFQSKDSGKLANT